MKKHFGRPAAYLFVVACAWALAACGGDSSKSGQSADAQSKQLHRSGKATASDYAPAVQELYIAYFGRPADPNGLINFENELAATNVAPDVNSLSDAYATNPRVTALVNSFETSAESIALYSGSSTTAFVTAIYQNVLGRAPDGPGLTFWVGAIDSHKLTQGDAALSIMAGAMKNSTSQGVQDAQLINNRLAVADYFTAQLTSQNLVSVYSGQAAAATARSMLNAVGANTDVTTFNATSVGASITSLLSPVTVTLDKSSVNIAGFIGNGYTVSQQSINVSISGASTSYYAKAVSDKPSVVQATFSETSNVAGIVTVQPATNLATVTTGLITVELCADSACSEVVWSQAVPYTISLFSIPSGGITLSGYEGASSSASIPVSPADTTGQLTLSTSTGTGAGWLTAVHNPDGTISVTASGVGLTPGNYQGYVTVSAGSPYASSFTMPVSFTVGDGIVAPAGGSINITGSSTSASLGGSARVSFNGNQRPSWTASSDQPWLVLGTASGVGAGTIQYSVNASSLGSVANWSSSTANITISAPGLTSVTVPVTLNMSLPEIDSVSPSVVVAGRATNVQVTGRGLSQLSSGSQISVAGVSGAAATITSDTGAVISLPALAAGRSAVSVSNALSISTRASAVGAADLSAIPYGTVTNAGTQPTALFDPSRNSLYTNNTTNSTLTRYHFNGSQWQVDGTPINNIGDMAFSPDRTTLYVASAGVNLFAVDPDTLQIKASYPCCSTNSSFPPLAPESYVPNGLGVTSNMRIWFNGEQWTNPVYFDILGGAFGTQPTPAGDLYSPVFYASGDGSRMVIEQGSLSPPQPNDIYLTATNAISAPAGVPQAYATGLNQDGSILLAGRTSVYNGINFNLIGNTPAAANGGIVMGAALSPDGTRVYQLVSINDNSYTIDHIDIYDVTQVQSSTSALTKLGQIAVTDQAYSCGSQSVYNCVPVDTFVISPLGDTLFWVGNQGLVAYPIPSEMSGVKSQVRRLHKAAIH